MPYLIKSCESEFTKNIGKEIGKRIFPGSVIALYGNLGAGKTVFVQGLAEGLDVQAFVTSPTFIIINEYNGKYPLYHIDTYRLSSSEDMYDLGYEEFFYGEGITAIEWASKIEDLLPEEHLRIEFIVKGELEREITITPFGQKFIDLIEEVIKAIKL